MIIPNIWENKKCSKPPTSKPIYQNKTIFRVGASVVQYQHTWLTSAVVVIFRPKNHPRMILWRLAAPFTLAFWLSSWHCSGWFAIGGFHLWGYPKWLVYGMENPKWMIWGYPYFRKPPILLTKTLNFHSSSYSWGACEIWGVAFNLHLSQVKQPPLRVASFFCHASHFPAEAWACLLGAYPCDLTFKARLHPRVPRCGRDTARIKI